MIIFASIEVEYLKSVYLESVKTYGKCEKERVSKFP
jgi:hypothetical protein